MMFDASSFAAA